MIQFLYELKIFILTEFSILYELTLFILTEFSPNFPQISPKFPPNFPQIILITFSSVHGFSFFLKFLPSCNINLFYFNNNKY